MVPTTTSWSSKIPSDQPCLSQILIASAVPTTSSRPLENPSSSPTNKPTFSSSISLSLMQTRFYPGYFNYDQSPGSPFGPGTDHKCVWFWNTAGQNAHHNWTRYEENRWGRIDPKLTLEYKTYIGFEKCFDEHYAKLEKIIVVSGHRRE
eukprot:4483886-Ditylum_brightwellii.AAC.1